MKRLILSTAFVGAALAFASSAGAAVTVIGGGLAEACANAAITGKSDRRFEDLCTQALSAIQWLTLWQATERGSPPPGQPPSCAWALAAVARLGGWMDSKHTGRPGYPSLWRGWDKLLDRVEAVELALPQQLPSTK